MEKFLASHEGTILLGTVIIAFLIVVTWEALAPRRPETKSLSYRWTNNIGLTLVNHLVVHWSSAALTLAVSWWAVDTNKGVLGHYEIGLAGAFVATLLVMELMAYLLHRLAHRVPLVWRLHAMHHSDIEVDFTTTYRHHPLENVIMLVISTPVVIALGAPVAAMVLYQVLRVSVNILSHSNILIPEGFERWLRYLIVTPDFHHLHHCSDRRFTDSNYSAAVPWFDFLFGTTTCKPYAAYADMELGLERFRDPIDSRIDQVLLTPFRGRRFADPLVSNPGQITALNPTGNST